MLLRIGRRAPFDGSAERVFSDQYLLEALERMTTGGVQVDTGVPRLKCWRYHRRGDRRGCQECRWVKKVLNGLITKLEGWRCVTQ